MAQLKSTNILGNLAISGNTLSSQFIKLGGTSSQLLRADGSASAISATEVTTALNYQPVKNSASSVTDHAIARFDGTTGLIVQGSTSATIDDSGNLSAVTIKASGSGTSDFSAGTLKFDTINIPTSSGGTTYGAGTSGYVLKSNGTTVYWGADNDTKTGTEFASAATVELTGDVTGSASSKKGWTVATTLKNSGVSAGSYGPNANATLAHSGTFSVPYVTVDAKGRVTSASTITYTLPASGNTDTKVTQTIKSDNKEYPLLLAPTGQTATKTTTACFATAATLNASTGALTLSGGINLAGGNTHITWNNGSYHQRIMNTDDSTANTAVFTFQQSTDSAATWTDLCKIYDNGTVEATKFKGNLEGTATRATKDGSGNTITSKYVTYDTAQTISGVKTLTNGIIFSGTTGIKYKGTQNTYEMIRFLDNTNDTYGNGIAIGGGGCVIIGSGESASNIQSATDLAIAASTESTYIGADNNIYLYSNCNTIGNRYTTTYDTSGNWTMPGTVKANVVNSNLIAGRAYPGGNTTDRYYKIASFTQSITSSQVNSALTMLVTGFYNNSSSNYMNGILKADLRWAVKETKPEFANLHWVTAGPNIVKENFILTHKTSSNTVTVEIYVKLSGWVSLNFTKLSEHNWGDSQGKFSWQFYQTISNASNTTNVPDTLPSDMTAVTSTFDKILNTAAEATQAAQATQATKDGAGNTITSKYVTLDTAQTISGTKTFSNLITANKGLTVSADGISSSGYINSSYVSSTWLNSVNGKSAFNVTGSGYTGWISGPANGGRIAISTYSSSNNNLYFLYMKKATIDAGTNSPDMQMRWEADTGTLFTQKFAVTSGTTTKTVMQYNSDYKALEFVFY